MSSSKNPTRAKVRRTLVPRSSIAAALVALDSVCRAGAESGWVQREQACHDAHATLSAEVAAVKRTLENKRSYAASIAMHDEQIKRRAGELVVKLRLYESAVAALARGDAVILRAAGLEPKSRAKASAQAVAVLRPTPLHGKTIPEVVAVVAAICDAGSKCQEVQSRRDPKSAFVRLRRALAEANRLLSQKAQDIEAMEQLAKALVVGHDLAVAALRVYEDMIDRAAGGDAARIAATPRGSTWRASRRARTRRRRSRSRAR
jgi:hypothetical protein